MSPMMRLMPQITAAVLAAFVGYIVAWYFDAVEGNFALLLMLASAITGAYWLAERCYFARQRRRAAQALEAAAAQRNAECARMAIAPPADGAAELRQAQARVLAQPWWLDWTAGLFPVIVSVFLLRSFLFEPFKIPSGSMMPTLQVGDLILVNKFTYGLRLPVFHTRITQGQQPARGDVLVFRYPPQPSLDYIKRVVGLPGDEVAYLNKRLRINGRLIEVDPAKDFLDTDSMRYFKQFEEHLADDRPAHRLLNNPQAPAFIQPIIDNFPGAGNCRYSAEGVACKVPPGHYFMMGDNRDNSQDSRYWGFVPEGNIVGRAFFVWMNLGNLKRIGSFD